MKKTVRNLGILLLGFLMMTSCEKQDLVGDPGTPVFMAEVPFVNDKTFEVTAGDELYYMYASHQKGDESVVHSGLFGKEDICETECAENFAIKLVQKNDVTPSKPTVGSYEYFSVPKDGFKHNFSMTSSDDEALEWTTWKIGNQSHFGQPSISFNSDNDSAPQKAIQLIYNVPQQFLVQLERPVLPKQVDCTVDFKIERVINEGVYLELTTASPFAFVNWSNGKVGNRIRLDFDSQVYTANVLDASGCQTKVVINFKTQNLTRDYSVSMQQESYTFATPDNADRAVIIEYTDPEGNFYTSSIIGQILPFDFEVHDVEAYENNELREPTWKIDASFDCILFSEDGSSKRIKNGKAIFAVSY